MATRFVTFHFSNCHPRVDQCGCRSPSLSLMSLSDKHTLQGHRLKSNPEERMPCSHGWAQLGHVGRYRWFAKRAIEYWPSHTSSLLRYCCVLFQRSLKPGDEQWPGAIHSSRADLHFFVCLRLTGCTTVMPFAAEVVVLGGEPQLLN